MIAKLRIAFPGFVLLLGAAFCLSQATPAQAIQDKQQEFAAHIQKARGYLDEKQPALAIPEFQAAVDIDPDECGRAGQPGRSAVLSGQGRRCPFLTFARVLRWSGSPA